MEEVELELPLEGQSEKHFQGADPRTPLFSFPASTNRCQTEPAATLQGGATCSLSVTLCHT